MKFQKTRFPKFALFLLLHFMASFLPCFADQLDFVDQDGPHGTPILRLPTKIPVGFKGANVHHLILPAGTPLPDLAPMISQRREELGLSPQVPMEEQEEFFQTHPWQVTKEITVKAPMPGRITRVFTHKGQQVKKGDLLYVLECMKMEMTMRSYFSGDISHVFIHVGEIIDSNSILMSLIPPSRDWEDIDPLKISKLRDLLRSFFPWTVATPLETYIAPQNPVIDREEQGVPMKTPEQFHKLSDQVQQVPLVFFEDRMSSSKTVNPVKIDVRITQSKHQPINERKIQSVGKNKKMADLTHLEKLTQITMGTEDMVREEIHKGEGKAKALRNHLTKLHGEFDSSPIPHGQSGSVDCLFYFL